MAMCAIPSMTEGGGGHGLSGVQLTSDHSLRLVCKITASELR